MRRLLPPAVVLIALASSHADEKINAPVPKMPPLPSIDGKYVQIEGNSFVADATIASNKITINPYTPNSVPAVLKYTLDTTKSPMTLDVDLVDTGGKRVKLCGIAEVNENRLTIALVYAGSGYERPKTTDQARGVAVYYFQKAPPPPKVEFRIVAMTAGKEADAEKELNKLVGEGFELVNTTNPIGRATDPKGVPTTVHFILKRTTKQQP